MFAQGFKKKSKILYQDNESVIIFINIERRSSSSKTKHIENRYIHIHDKVQNGEIIVEYLPTIRCGLIRNTLCDEMGDLVEVRMRENCMCKHSKKIGCQR